MAEAAKHDVFVSYKREDRPRILPIVEKLRELHLNVWFDAGLIPGEAFDKEIHARLKEVKAVLVCWSQAAVASDYVRGEALFGQERRMLVAVRLEECELPPPFNVNHGELLAHWAGDHSSLSWQKVLARLGELCGRGAALVRWAQLQSMSTEADRASFIADYPKDPLTSGVKAMLIHDAFETTRSRLSRLIGEEVHGVSRQDPVNERKAVVADGFAKEPHSGPASRAASPNKRTVGADNEETAEEKVGPLRTRNQPEQPVARAIDTAAPVGAPGRGPRSGGSNWVAKYFAIAVLVFVVLLVIANQLAGR